MKDVYKFNQLLHELQDTSMKFATTSSIKEMKELSNKIILIKEKLNKMYNN